MKIEVVMPKMGESLQEGTIVKWLKNVGETVERDEMILEISTDKVDTEVPSPNDGTIVEILAEENDTIEVGKVIAIIETDATDQKSEPAEIIPEPEVEKPAPPSDVETIEVVMPKMGESLQEGTIVKWLKNVGETVERDEMILEISTDKVDTEVPSPANGTLIEVLAEEGDTIEVGNVIARITTGGKAATPKVKTPAPKDSSSEPAKEKSEPAYRQIAAGTTFDIPRKHNDKFFSPLVRTIAEKNRIPLEELETLKGSGIEGRITKNDLLKYIENKNSGNISASTAVTERPQTSPATVPDSKPVKMPSAQPQSMPEQNIQPIQGDEVIPMDRVRSLIAEHMVFSMRTSAHVTSVDEADLTGIVKYRNKVKDEFFKREGVKLTFMPFFAKAVIDALKEYPMVNVSVDGKNIIKHNRINLGIATALEDGNLIVPVIKDADDLSITGLAKRIADLANRARTKQLSPDEIQGGTFTITNFGSFGTLFGSPIINQPEVAILGVGAIKKRPVVKEIEGDYAIVPRDISFISLSYDHRVVDGMLGGLFTMAVVKNLEKMAAGNIQL